MFLTRGASAVGAAPERAVSASNGHLAALPAEGALLPGAPAAQADAGVATGTVVAIGLGVFLAALLTLLVAFVWWRWRRRGGGPAAVGGEKDGGNVGTVPAVRACKSCMFRGSWRRAAVVVLRNGGVLLCMAGLAFHASYVRTGPHHDADVHSWFRQVVGSRAHRGFKSARNKNYNSGQHIQHSRVIHNMKVDHEQCNDHDRSNHEHSSVPAI